jgi:tetratricopeptide (TPR) repeat protein
MIESKSFTNPFPGLRPFETDEYRLFFGREGQSDSLITRLQRSRFLAVVGTSGSGKSSLVRAGLLPALRGGMMAGAGSGWRICIMRPGSDPIGNLALALADKDVLLEAGAGLPPAEAEAVIEATLRRGSLGLVEVARQARLAAHEKLLVVVDQFEELFRFRAARASSSTGDDASAFVKLLLEASQQPDLSIYVVPTMRSDFLGDCAQFQGLPEAINDGQYLIPRMTRDERRFAITGPVGVTRGKITEPLVNRLMNDVGDNPDQLPILQHALMRTWDYWAAHRRNGEPIGLEHYEAVGTMSDALSKHADEAFDDLPDERSRLIAEILFKALTERGADNREIRRPTCLKDICAIANATALEVGAVIDVFRGGGRSFLMPPAGVALQPETVIDISHESLIRNWLRLKEWVKDEAESARIYRRLAGAATDYRDGAGGLLDDVTLQYVLRWRERSKPDRAWGVRYRPEFDSAMAYLEESRAARDARIEAEQQREQLKLETARAFAEKQARSARRMRWLTAALGVILLFALGSTVYAFIMKRSAENSQKRTLVLAGNLDETRRSAAALKLEAERDRTVADAALAKALAEEKSAALAKADAERATGIAAEAKRQAAIDKQSAADNLRIAKIARTEAEANAKEIKEAVERDELLRKSIQASRRDDPEEALGYLEQLKAKLEPGATSAPGSNPSPERGRRSLLELGWTLSDIGDVYRRLQVFSNAIENYEKALVKLKQVLPEDSNDSMLFGTYHGLAHSYRDAATQEGRSGPETRKTGRPAVDIADARQIVARRQQLLAKAEEFFKKALAFQQKHRPDKPAEVANGHLNLARLYVDLSDDTAAKQNYEQAIGLLNDIDREGADAARRELGQFLGNAGRYAEAEKVYNKLITSQEDITVEEIADKGQGIANIYSELADVYRADGKQKQADDVFKVANLIQKVSLKLKRSAKDNPANVNLKLDDDLDAMGDAYIQLGKFSDAEVLYKKALEQRRERPELLWKSYDKLAALYREFLKDDKRAEEYNNLLLGLLEKNKDTSNNYVSSLVQLAALYVKTKRYEEAGTLYTRALGIASAQDDWQYPNQILDQQAQLYSKQNKVTEREQMIRQRLEMLTSFINRLDAPARRPKVPINLVSAYLNAIEATADFQSNVRKDDAGARAAYESAFTRFGYITANVYNAKVLETYAVTLEHYQTLLNKTNMPADAARVGGKVKELREKLLPQLNYTQNTAQQGPATSPTAP